MLYIVCLHHCMYICYMFIKYQSINQFTSILTDWAHVSHLQIHYFDSIT